MIFSGHNLFRCNLAFFLCTVVSSLLSQQLDLALQLFPQVFPALWVVTETLSNCSSGVNEATCGLTSTCIKNQGCVCKSPIVRKSTEQETVVRGVFCRNSSLSIRHVKNEDHIFVFFVFFEGAVKK